MENMEVMRDFYRGKKILITGHTGFQGAWLNELLLQWGAQVVGVAKEPHTNPNLFDLLLHRQRVKHYVADVRNYGALQSILDRERPEILFHLAAQAVVRESYDNPLDTHTTNIIGTANVLHAAREVPGIRAAVIVTTDKVYRDEGAGRAYREEDPLGGYDPYGASKAAADIVAHSYIRSFFHPDDFGKKHQTLFAIARSGNVVGGGDWSKDRIMPDIVRAVYEQDGVVRIRNPKAIRPWQHVFEALYGYLLLGKLLYEGEQKAVSAWNFGPEEANFVPVEELTRQALGKIGQGSYEISQDPEKPESEILMLDIAKAKRELGWKPLLDLDQTLALTVDWYRSHYAAGRDIGELSRTQLDSFFGALQ